MVLGAQASASAIVRYRAGGAVAAKAAA